MRENEKLSQSCWKQKILLGDYVKGATVQALLCSQPREPREPLYLTIIVCHHSTKQLQNTTILDARRQAVLPWI